MEIRDPLHVFVRLEPEEQAVLNSRPFQRLRFIHQLALSFLVYPGATHRRFEHSLGVMELASRIFDVVTDVRNRRQDAAREVVPEDELRLQYWKRVLRMAALCHDIGHLPFSHAAEKQLLPDGWDHERLSRELILSEEMRTIWQAMEPPINPEHIALVAVGPSKENGAMRPWEAILNEIITGNVFGADRMDYLLRDSHHIGVAYGRFDHFRLIDTLRILPEPPTPDGGSEPREPTLGIEHGGVESAEALLLARYFMYSQVYFHRTRRIYDIHLKDFLHAWLDDQGHGRHFPTDLSSHLAITDNEVLAAIASSAATGEGDMKVLAERIVERRKRFGLVYEPSPADLLRNVDAGRQVAAALKRQFSEGAVRHDAYRESDDPFDFPVQRRDGEVVSSTHVSDVLDNVPTTRIDYVFLDRQYLADAERWIEANRDSIIEPQAAEDDEATERDGRKEDG